MWTKVLFLAVVYVGSFISFLWFSVSQHRQYKKMDMDDKTMKDFEPKCTQESTWESQESMDLLVSLKKEIKYFLDFWSNIRVFGPGEVGIVQTPPRSAEISRYFVKRSRLDPKRYSLDKNKKTSTYCYSRCISPKNYIFPFFKR